LRSLESSEQGSGRDADTGAQYCAQSTTCKTAADLSVLIYDYAAVHP